MKYKYCQLEAPAKINDEISPIFLLSDSFSIDDSNALINYYNEDDISGSVVDIWVVFNGN